MLSAGARYIALCAALLAIALSLAFSPAAGVGKSPSAQALVLDAGAGAGGSAEGASCEDKPDGLPPHYHAPAQPTPARSSGACQPSPAWLSQPWQIRPIRAPPSFA